MIKLFNVVKNSKVFKGILVALPFFFSLSPEVEAAKTSSKSKSAVTRTVKKVQAPSAKTQSARAGISKRSQLRTARATRAARVKQAVGQQRAKRVKQAVGQQRAARVNQAVGQQRAKRVNQAVGQQRAKRVNQAVGQQRTTRVKQAIGQQRTTRVNQAVGQQRTTRVNQAVGQQRTTRVNQAVGQQRTTRVKQAIGQQRTTRVKQAAGQQRANQRAGQQVTAKANPSDVNASTLARMDKLLDLLIKKEAVKSVKDNSTSAKITEIMDFYKKQEERKIAKKARNKIYGKEVHFTPKESTERPLEKVQMSTEKPLEKAQVYEISDFVEALDQSGKTEEEKLSETLNFFENQKMFTQNGNTTEVGKLGEIVDFFAQQKILAKNDQTKVSRLSGILDFFEKQRMVVMSNKPLEKAQVNEISTFVETLNKSGKPKAGMLSEVLSFFESQKMLPKSSNTTEVGRLSSLVDFLTKQKTLAKNDKAEVARLSGILDFFEKQKMAAKGENTASTAPIAEGVRKLASGGPPKSPPKLPPPLLSGEAKKSASVLKPNPIEKPKSVVQSKPIEKSKPVTKPAPKKIESSSGEVKQVSIVSDPQDLVAAQALGFDLSHSYKDLGEATQALSKAAGLKDTSINAQLEAIPDDAPEESLTNLYAQMEALSTHKTRLKEYLIKKFAVPVAKKVIKVGGGDFLEQIANLGKGSGSTEPVKEKSIEELQKETDAAVNKIRELEAESSSIYSSNPDRGAELSREAKALKEKRLKTLEQIDKMKAASKAASKAPSKARSRVVIQKTPVALTAEQEEKLDELTTNHPGIADFLDLLEVKEKALWLKGVGVSVDYEQSGNVYKEQEGLKKPMTVKSRQLPIEYMISLLTEDQQDKFLTAIEDREEETVVATSVARFAALKLLKNYTDFDGFRTPKWTRELEDKFVKKAPTLSSHKEPVREPEVTKAQNLSKSKSTLESTLKFKRSPGTTNVDEK